MNLRAFPMLLMWAAQVAIVSTPMGCREREDAPVTLKETNSLEAQIEDELVPFRPSAEELRILVSYRKQQIPILDELEPGKPTEEREMLHQQLALLDQRLKEQMGTNRYEFYLVTQSVGYRQAYEIVKKYNLPSSRLEEFVRLRYAVRRRAALATKGAEQWQVALFARDELVRLFGWDGYKDLRPDIMEIFGVPFIRSPRPPASVRGG